MGSIRKYNIYHNDLKYKRNRNLESNKILWGNNNLKYLFDNVDLDSIEYRLYECRKTGMVNLDLSDMDLIEFPNIPKEYKNQIKCLFITENELEYIPDLHDYIRLEILEISNNKVNDIYQLPPTLIELCCRNNQLSRLPPINECPNIERIDCASNEITEIPVYKKLKSLICSNNRLTMIPNLENLNKLICNKNIINYIGVCGNLKYLDCSSNKLIKLNNYELLVDMICSNNNIYELLSYKNLQYLEIFNTPIFSIPFMKNLQELYCEKKMIKCVARQYIEERDSEVKISKEKNLHICFKKKV